MSHEVGLAVEIRLLLHMEGIHNSYYIDIDRYSSLAVSATGGSFKEGLELPLRGFGFDTGQV